MSRKKDKRSATEALYVSKRLFEKCDFGGFNRFLMNEKSIKETFFYMVRHDKGVAESVNLCFPEMFFDNVAKDVRDAIEGIVFDIGCSIKNNIDNIRQHLFGLRKKKLSNHGAISHLMDVMVHLIGSIEYSDEFACQVMDMFSRLLNGRRFHLVSVHDLHVLRHHLPEHWKDILNKTTLDEFSFLRDRTSAYFIQFLLNLFWEVFELMFVLIKRDYVIGYTVNFSTARYDELMRPVEKAITTIILPSDPNIDRLPFFKRLGNVPVKVEVLDESCVDPSEVNLLTAPTLVEKVTVEDVPIINVKQEVEDTCLDIVPFEKGHLSFSGMTQEEEERFWGVVWKSARFRVYALGNWKPKESFWDRVTSSPDGLSLEDFSIFPQDVIAPIAQVFSTSYVSARKVFSRIPIYASSAFLSDFEYSTEKTAVFLKKIVKRSLKSMKLTEEFLEEISRVAMKNENSDHFDRRPKLESFIAICSTIRKSEGLENEMSLFYIPIDTEYQGLLAGCLALFVLNFFKSTKNLLFEPSKFGNKWIFSLEKYRALKRKNAMLVGREAVGGVKKLTPKRTRKSIDNNGNMMKATMNKNTAEETSVGSKKEAVGATPVGRKKRKSNEMSTDGAPVDIEMVQGKDDVQPEDVMSETKKKDKTKKRRSSVLSHSVVSSAGTTNDNVEEPIVKKENQTMVEEEQLGMDGSQLEEDLTKKKKDKKKKRRSSVRADPSIVDVVEPVVEKENQTVVEDPSLKADAVVLGKKRRSSSNTKAVEASDSAELINLGGYASDSDMIEIETEKTKKKKARRASDGGIGVLEGYGMVAVTPEADQIETPVVKKKKISRRTSIIGQIGADSELMVNDGIDENMDGRRLDRKRRRSVADLQDDGPSCEMPMHEGSGPSKLDNVLFRGSRSLSKKLSKSVGSLKNVIDDPEASDLMKVKFTSLISANQLLEIELEEARKKIKMYEAGSGPHK